MSLATNLSYSDFSRFIRSARRFCPIETTDVVLFVQPMEPQFVELANELQVTLVPIVSFWREVSSNLALKILYRLFLLALQMGAALGSPGFAQVHRSITAHWIHAICTRHFAGRDFLAVNPTYRCVLLSDSRDVIFQGNPFPLVDPQVLNVFEQDPSLKYGGSNIDTDWFAKVFSPKLLNALRGKQTLCAGTVMGSPAVLLDYLARMEAEILARKYRVIDQAVHNKLVYLDLPKGAVQIHSNRSGLILTLGETSGDGYEVVGDQVTVGGEVVPVVHQYDRIPQLKSMFGAMYASPESNSVMTS
jgi:hypothetical protein